MSQPKGNLYTFGFAFGICVVCSLILSSAATMLKPKQVANIRHDIRLNILTSVGHDPAELAAKPKNEIFEMFEREFEVVLLDSGNKTTDRSFMETELVQVLKYPEAQIKALDSGDLLSRFNSKKSLLAKRAEKPLGLSDKDQGLYEKLKTNQANDLMRDGEAERLAELESFKEKQYDPEYKIVYIHRKDGVPNAYVVPIEGYGLWDIIKGYLALDTDLNRIKGVTFYEHKETPGLGARITEDWFKKSFINKTILDEKGNLVSVTVAKGKAPADHPHQVDGISGATLTGKGINQFLMRDLKTYEPFFKSLREQP